MKQYTTPEQTAKLIKLGFEKPKSIEVYREGHCVPFVEQRWDYSIAELIEMLQKRVYEIEYSCIPCDLNIHYDGETWLILFICESEGIFKTERLELIDALYLMIIKLKEEGAI